MEKILRGLIFGWRRVWKTKITREIILTAVLAIITHLVVVYFTQAQATLV